MVTFYEGQRKQIQAEIRRERRKLLEGPMGGGVHPEATGDPSSVVVCTVDAFQVYAHTKSLWTFSFFFS